MARRALYLFITLLLGLSAAPMARAVDATDPLARFYAQDLQWTPCRGGSLQCAWLTVPLDYARPDDKTIRLRVSKAVSKGSNRIGSLVINPGGPGGSGLDMPAYLASTLSTRVKDTFDLVGFDPRGVGRSAPITCLTGAQTTRFYAADPTPKTRAEERSIIDLGRQLARGCQTLSPQMASHVGTDETVADLDILRAALKDDRLNWLGYSYGTQIGAQYAQRFPDRIGRFVLDGAVDPSLDLMEISEGQSRGFQTALRRFADDCASRSTCPYPGNATAVLKGISSLLDRLETRSLPGTYEPLNESAAITAIFYSLYSPYNWSYLRRALAQAERGNGRGLSELANGATRRTGPNSYSGNMASAFPAISCWDAPAAPGIAGLRTAAAQWSRSAAVPRLAQAMAWSNAVCSNWFGHSPNPPAPVTSTTTSPILIVGTRFDPATPYPWAQALSRQLPTSRLLTYNGDGHTAYSAGSSCIDTAVDDYLVAGELPVAGKTCG